MENKRLTEWNKTKNKNRTKEEIICEINEIKKNGQDIILVESNKRRINISINEFVLRQIEAKYSNKSEHIEELLIKEIEAELHKKLEFTKHKGNY